MTYKIINRKIKDVINEIEKHNNLIRYKLSKNFVDSYDKELWAISLYYTLISLVKNIIAIFDNDNNTVGILIIVRSCLEAYINLENVFNNYDKYLKYEKAKLEEEKKQIEKITHEPNKFTKSKKFELMNYLEDLLSKNKSLTGVEPKYLVEKAKRASIELPDHLEIFYKICSEHVHCGHGAVMQRYVNKTSNNKYQASKVKRYPKPIILYSILTLLEVLWISIVRVYFRICSESFNHNLKGIQQAISACNNKIQSEIQVRHDKE